MSIIETAYRNSKSLQAAIDKVDYFPVFQDHLESLEQTEHDNMIDMYLTEPHWIDYYNMPINEAIDTDNITMEYCPGYYCQPIGTIRPDTKQVFAGTLQAPQEIELQACDGNFAYYYIGGGFYEVWINQEDYTGEVTE